jgi:hypothetical protein
LREDTVVVDVAGTYILIDLFFLADLFWDNSISGTNKFYFWKNEFYFGKLVQATLHLVLVASAINATVGWIFSSESGSNTSKRI